jgi:hypothetical protein
MCDTRVWHNHSRGHFPAVLIRMANSCGSRGLQQLNLSPPIHVSKETILEMWHAVTHGEALRYGDDYTIEQEGTFSKNA